LETTVLHEEMPYRPAEWEARAAAKIRQDRRPLSAWLKTTAMGLGLLRLQLDAGLFEEMRATLAGVQNSFQLLRYGVDGEMESLSPKRPLAPAALIQDLSEQLDEAFSGV
jgi:hypothetical protein